MREQWLRDQARLRDAALAELQASDLYRAFRAFDAAVVALGGVSAAHAEVRPERTVEPDQRAEFKDRPEPKASPAAATAYGNHAVQVLETIGRPLSMQDLYDFAVQDGLSVGGTKPLENFRSSISRDHRFKAIGGSNKFVWWFADRDLPKDEGEAEPNMLTKLNGSASPLSSQEGGDGRYDPATT